MSWAAAAVAGGAIVGGALSAQGSKQAADAQGRASGAAIGEQARQYDLSRADSATYRASGNAANQRLMDLLGLQSPGAGQAKTAGDLVLTTSGGPILNPKYENDPDVVRAWNETLALHNQQQGVSGYNASSSAPWILNQVQSRLPAAAAAAPPSADFGALNKKFTTADFENDPVVQLGLKYGLDLGTKAIDRGAGATGLRNSGATLKALTRFGQDYAGSKAGESYNRFYGDQDRIYNRLAGISGTGQTATQNTSALGQASAQNIGNILTAQGNARGAAAIGQANAYGGALNTIGNYYGQQATLDKILNSRNQQTSGTIYQTGMD